MGSRYSEAFIEQALIKVYSRGDRTVPSVAEELNVHYKTVKNWIYRKFKRVGIHAYWLESMGSESMGSNSSAPLSRC